MTISLHGVPDLLAGAARAREASSDSIQRFDTHQRIQHFLMMSTFITLVLTGLPQRFSELGISQWWIATLGGLEQARTIHRIAGIVMVLDCLYHLTYLFFRVGVQGRRGPLQMIPTMQDARDAFQMVRYFLGTEPEKPRFGRFSYLEKFDYWAVFWGIAVIGGSGLILMFHVAVTRYLPGQVLPLAEVLHGDEAILATGWILIVHMFNAHLAPWVFPFNPTVFTGKMSRERYREDHPLEYERICSQAAPPASSQSLPHGPAAGPDATGRRNPPARLPVGADGGVLRPRPWSPQRGGSVGPSNASPGESRPLRASGEGPAGEKKP